MLAGAAGQPCEKVDVQSGVLEEKRQGRKMMQTIFRVILVIVSFMTVAFMMRRIRQAKVQIEAALFWVALSAILFVFAVFPPLADLCARLLGIYSTPNFLFLSMIFLLMVKLFAMTLQVSQLESRLKELVQKLALEEKKKEELLEQSAQRERELAARLEKLEAGEALQERRAEK